jgi:NTE family protein
MTDQQSLESFPAAGTPGIGVCLGSSFLGFYAHAGFLQGLVGQGLHPSHISGSSAGAIVAGLHAAGFPPDRLIRDLLSLDFIRTFFEPTVGLRGIAMLVNAPGINGLLKGDRFRRHLRTMVGDLRIEDCSASRLTIAVTNLANASSELRRRGPLVESISASAAVPLLFSAVDVEGSFCWDGGVTNSMPVDAFCEDESIHTVIAHRVVRHQGQKSLPEGARPSIASAFNLGHEAMGRRVFEIACERLAATGRRLIVCETETGGLPINQKLRQAHIELGRVTARTNIPLVTAPCP